MSLTSVAVAAAAAIAYRGVGGGIGGLFSGLGGQTSPMTPSAAAGLFPPQKAAMASSATTVIDDEPRQTSNQLAHRPRHRNHHHQHQHQQQHRSSFGIHQLLGLDSCHSEDDEDDDDGGRDRDVIVQKSRMPVSGSRGRSPSPRMASNRASASPPRPSGHNGAVNITHRQQYDELLKQQQHQQQQQQQSIGRHRALPGWSTVPAIENSRSIFTADDLQQQRSQLHHQQHQAPSIVHAANALHSINAWRQNLQLAFTAAAAAAAVTQNQQRVPGQHHHQQHQHHHHQQPHLHHPAIAAAHVHAGFMHGHAGAALAPSPVSNEHHALQNAAASLATYDHCRLQAALMTSLPDSSDVNNTGR